MQVKARKFWNINLEKFGWKIFQNFLVINGKKISIEGTFLNYSLTNMGAKKRFDPKVKVDINLVFFNGILQLPRVKY